jgi:hypothetical protein
MWGMWKSGSVFDPNAVGEASAQVGKTLATAH